MRTGSNDESNKILNTFTYTVYHSTKFECSSVYVSLVSMEQYFSVGTGYGQPDINCDKYLKIALFSIPEFFFYRFMRCRRNKDFYLETGSG